jgi:hypothetical protein
MLRPSPEQPLLSSWGIVQCLPSPPRKSIQGPRRPRYCLMHRRKEWTLGPPDAAILALSEDRAVPARTHRSSTHREGPLSAYYLRLLIRNPWASFWRLQLSEVLPLQASSRLHGLRHSLLFRGQGESCELAGPLVALDSWGCSRTHLRATSTSSATCCSLWYRSAVAARSR